VCQGRAKGECAPLQHKSAKLSKKVNTSKRENIACELTPHLIPPQPIPNLQSMSILVEFYNVKKEPCFGEVLERANFECVRNEFSVEFARSDVLMFGSFGVGSRHLDLDFSDFRH